MSFPPWRAAPPLLAGVGWPPVWVVSGLQWEVRNLMAAVAWGLYPERRRRPAPMRAVGIGWLWGA